VMSHRRWVDRVQTRRAEAACSRLPRAAAQTDPTIGPALSVLIPVAFKDSHKVRHVVESVQRHVMHSLERICLVGDPDVAHVAKSCGVDFLHENDVLPPEFASWMFIPRGMDRSGWLKQQLLKLSCDELFSTSHTLVIDSDTIFLQPVQFLDGEDPIFYCSSEYHSPYFRAMREFADVRKQVSVSFVSHHMVLPHEVVRDLKRRAEVKHAQPWWAALLRSLSANELSAFSEYETVGNFLLQSGRSAKLVNWMNYSCASESEWMGLTNHSYHLSASLHSPG
jgi:hypothetical protein